MADSWWLKVKRAQKHMVDINREVRRYAELQPYEFIRIREPDRNRRIQYRTRITQQPNPMLSLMIGDFVHNLRSALDHIIVACVPKRYRSNATGYPVAYQDLFAKEANGDFVVKDAEARENFERAIRGLDPRARAFVILAQPYQWGAAEADSEILGIISRLDNADKHRKIATLTGGLTNLVADIRERGGAAIRFPRTLTTSGQNFAGDNTIVGFTLPAASKLKPSEVDVQFSGSPLVTVEVTGIRGNEKPIYYPLRSTALEAMKAVRAALRLLEPFVV